MPSTWSQIILHVVFCTKAREPWIDEPLATRLYPFIGGIVRQEGGTLWEIGGVNDHVHVLMRVGTEMSIADLMREIKARSSKWIHETFSDKRDFAWQPGYGVFSVSKSQSEVVKLYIRNQAEHHRAQDFSAELRVLLSKHGVEFDDRYVD